MGQTHEMTTNEVETPLTAAINASIFVPFTGIPAVLPTDHESQLKLLKSHHHKVRENIVTAFVLEKERLLSKCKDDLAKHERLMAGDGKGKGLKSDFQLSVAVKEDARRKKEAEEFERAKWLRGPRWLLLLQMEDAKNGVWNVPAEETDEERQRREARFKNEMGKREARLLNEMEGHTMEEYQWKPKDFYDFELEHSSLEPHSEPRSERGSEGDVVMGGMDPADASLTQDGTPAKITTRYEIEHKFNVDVHRLLEEGIKTIKDYDQHAEKVVAEYKQARAKGSTENIETAGSGGSLKRKSGSMASPLDPPGGILKRTGSIQSQSENGSSTVKKSVSIQLPSDTEKHASIQSSSENGGGILKKSASIQTLPERSSSTLKKSVSIQIPTDNQIIPSNTSSFQK
ncbi:hypothetical protein DSL72_006096 [Monilinia vaccinii-corymbosi]|uniref:Uncharacterized protein n=1 Tax=Monilinia vaccinii-corymbosi TaxID=61207 RepID=A0A8A3PGS9_9HELO|nr:hypothetical protein DSL72_006096 [Monilinia vaccinii-corymbosi]